MTKVKVENWIDWITHKNWAIPTYVLRTSARLTIKTIGTHPFIDIASSKFKFNRQIRKCEACAKCDYGARLTMTLTILQDLAPRIKRGHVIGLAEIA
jgi:hypothetical protein